MRKLGTVREWIVAVFALFACLMLLFVMESHSFADVIYEPEGSFFKSNRDFIYNYDRKFLANSPDEGGLKVYESPVSKTVLETYENNTEVYVEYIYTDKAGNEWCCVSSSFGWVPKDYLAEIYDNVMFREEHGAEIVSADGSIDVAALGENAPLYFYEYPGAKEGFNANMGEKAFYSEVYTDEAGHKWGYVSYYYLSKGWVCIDAPSATYDELYPSGQSFSGSAPDPVKPAIVVEPSVKGANAPLIIGICIGAIVIITGVILLVVFKKSAKKKQDK
ncbi:MAG: hypothetical protein K5669_06005 [Lachnospiraceae bacterium]|nr:hypothetical protein [Lachnospiraceae bacterium]